MPQQLAPASPSISRNPVECRLYVRLACDVLTSCLPTSSWGNKDARWPASISDVSQAGLRLVARRRFEAGAGLGIELPGYDGGEPSIVLARVIHVKGLPDGSWAMGCKFISELGEDELQRLIPAPPPPPTPPAPISPSALLNNAVTKKAISEVDLQLELPDGRVMGCSVPSLSIPGTWPLAAGKTLTMRLNTTHGLKTLLKLKVVRCTQQGERWTLRARLLQPSWDNVIRALNGSA